MKVAYALVLGAMGTLGALVIASSLFVVFGGMLMIMTGLEQKGTEAAMPFTFGIWIGADVAASMGGGWLANMVMGHYRRGLGALAAISGAAALGIMLWDGSNLLACAAVFLGGMAAGEIGALVARAELEPEMVDEPRRQPSVVSGLGRRQVISSSR